MIVATDAGELNRLEELERRGKANGVPGLRRIDASGIEALEPHARGIAGLHSPSTGIVDFPAVARAYAKDVLAAGGAVATGCGVQGVEVKRRDYVCCTRRVRPSRARDLLRRGLGRSTGGRSRCGPRPADRAVPRSLPTAEAGEQTLCAR